jgi:CheY-like chemotaxis protein
VFFFERAMKQAHFAQPLRVLRVVRDGHEAIAYLSEHGAFSDRIQTPLPCLIVLDLNLPRKHGLEVLQWIRASAPDPSCELAIGPSLFGTRREIPQQRERTAPR